MAANYCKYHAVLSTNIYQLSEKLSEHQNDIDEEASGVVRVVVRRFAVGERIRFAEERHAYTIQAKDDRFLICTKPFNPKKTVLYSIVDLIENIRGTENLIFCMGFENQKQCEEALERIRSGKSEISYRNRIPLIIV